MIKEKEVLSLEEIDKKLKETDKRSIDEKQKNTEKREFLKDLYQDDDYKDKKKDIVKKLVPIIRNSREVSKHLLSYDSLSEGMEPIYYWILDFMQDTGPSGLGMKVRKFEEGMEASVTSGYFGEIGQRATLMQQKAMEYLGTINNIIKSLLNLIYDLKEFEIRLKAYDDLKSERREERDAAVRVLKGMWMDQVDARKGRASINLLAQDLNFVTIRDAFFHVNDIKVIDEKLDLNERVKTILKRKLHEYLEWQKLSEKEIRTRYNVEKAYLKSQVATLKLYADWVKPYLKAAQKLKMKEFNKADLVHAFSNMEFEITLHGQKEIKPGDIHESFKEVELDTKYYAIIEVTMHFRSVPSVMTGQGGRHYVHGGRTDIIFKGLSVDDVELSALESWELYESIDLIEDYIGTSLKEIEDEVAKYTKKEEPEKKEEKKKHTVENPFEGVIESFKNMFSPIKDLHIKRKKSGIIYEELESTAASKAKGMAYTAYNIYKKTHGMQSI